MERLVNEILCSPQIGLKHALVRAQVIDKVEVEETTTGPGGATYRNPANQRGRTALPRERRELTLQLDHHIHACKDQGEISKAG